MLEKMLGVMDGGVGRAGADLSQLSLVKLPWGRREWCWSGRGLLVRLPLSLVHPVSLHTRGVRRGKGRLCQIPVGLSQPHQPYSVVE